MLKKILMFIGAIAVISAIASGMGGEDATNSSDNTTYAEDAVAELEEAADDVTAETESVADEEPTKEAKPEPQYTSAQENAIAAAKDYLSYSAFSKSGLIKQLKFEDYNVKDAKFAVNHIKVNWNQQAVASAKDYLSYSSFSKSGLVDQLKFEGFTQAQATYGANQAY